MMTAEQLSKLLGRIAIYNDCQAYKALFMDYHQPLVRFSTSITRCKEWAEDVVSDVFLKLWIQRKALQQIRNFHLYIYVTTRNLSINRLLKEQKLHHFSIDDMEVRIMSLNTNPEELMITSEMKNRIHRSVNELPNRCRLIFKLIKEDGFSYKETAELLDLSLKTIENQMTIAFKKIGESISLKFSGIKMN